MSALSSKASCPRPRCSRSSATTADRAGDARLRGRAGARAGRRRRWSRRPRPRAIAGVCKAELFDVPAHRRRPARAPAAWRSRWSRSSPRRWRCSTPSAAGYVHWGSTSQDVIDTAMVLRDAARAGADRRATWRARSTRCSRWPDAHGDAPMLGRTLMQPAQVVSFGFKVVGLGRAAGARPRAPARGRRTRRCSCSSAARSARWRCWASTAAGGGAARGRARCGLRAAAGAWHTQRDDMGRARLRASACSAARSARSRATSR